MAIPVQDFSFLTQPVSVHEQADFFSPLTAILKWKKEREDAKKENETRHEQAKQELSMRQGSLAHQMQQDVLAGQQRDRAFGLDNQRLEFDKQRLADSEEEQKREHEDRAFGNLYGAIGKHNPALTDAYLQDLQRRGFTVERDDPQLALAGAGAPSMPEPEKTQAPPQVPGDQRKLSALDSMGASAVGAIQNSPSSRRNGYGGLPEGSGMARPSPARSGGLGGPAEQPWGRNSLNPSLTDATGVVQQPWADSGPSGIPQPQGRPMPAPPEPTEEPALPPARTEADLAQPALPAARAAPPGHSVRVRDQKGNVVFGFDPTTGDTSHRDAILQAIGVTQAGARDPEEQRAADMAVATVAALSNAGMPDAKVMEEGRKTYQFELDRLGKKRLNGTGGAAPSGDLSGKEHDKRFANVERIIAGSTTRNRLAKMNDELNEVATVELGLDSKSGFAHLNAMSHMLKATQGRISNTDKEQADASFGKINEAKMLLSRWTGEGQMPPAVLKALREAAESTRRTMLWRKKDIAESTADAILKHPDLKFKDEADRKKMRDYAVNALEGGDYEAPTEAPATEPAVAPAATPTAAAPAKKKRNPAEAAQFLIDKM